MRREERAPRRLREVRGMVVFELERMLSSRRVGAALVILLAAVFVASKRLSVLAGQQGSLAGATALDGFYFALNDQTVAALLLPTACLVLCGSLFSGDAEDEMGLLLVSRLRWRSDYVAAKLVATFAGCLFCVAALFALALLVGAVAAEKRLLHEVAEALADAPAGHAVVGGVHDRVLRRREVVQKHFAVFAEGARNHVGDGNVGKKNRMHDVSRGLEFFLCPFFQV